MFHSNLMTEKLKMKTILALLLLLPNLSWGNDYLKKQINIIYNDITTKENRSYDIYFYVEQIADAIVPLSSPWELCYKKLVKNISSEVYDKYYACLIYRTSFGFTSEEYLVNLEKFSKILKKISEFQNSGKFKLDISDKDKFNSNSANIEKAVIIMKNVHNLASQI